MDLTTDATSMRAGAKRHAAPLDQDAVRDAQRPRLQRPAASPATTSSLSSDSTWSSLPLVAMELVFSFALVDLSVHIDPIPAQHQRAVTRHVADAFSLRKWATVCRSWRDAIEQLIAQHQEGTVRLDFVLKRTQDQAQLISQCMKSRSMVQDLRVAIYRHVDAPLHPVLPSIQWTAMLKECVNLQRLDVSNMNCLKRDEICDVMDAVSKCCPRLRALVFPLPYGWTRPACLYTTVNRLNADVDKPVVSSLAVALKRWHDAGGASGSSLEQLVLPFVGNHADEFLALVTKFAPRIQLLDAWKLTYFHDGWDDVRCDEHWHLKKEVWEAFCRACVHLREFNWTVIPFNETFLAPFASVKKWQLKELTINFTKCAAPVFQVVNQGQAHLRRSLGMQTVASSDVSSASLCNLVQVLPRLEVLRVNLQSGGGWKLDTYDDDFLVALAKACPNLKQLYIAGGSGYSSSLTLEKVTDRGLAAIGRLSKLEELALRPLDVLQANSLERLIGNAKGALQLDAKLMLPPRVLLHEIIQPIIKNLAESIAQSTREFAIQIAIQQPKEREHYNPSQHAMRPQSSRAAMEMRKCTDSLRALQNTLSGPRSRLRFQAFVEEHTRRIMHINLFTTNWKSRGHLGALYLKNEIVYDHAREDEFEWVVVN